MRLKFRAEHQRDVIDFLLRARKYCEHCPGSEIPQHEIEAMQLQSGNDQARFRRLCAERRASLPPRLYVALVTWDASFLPGHDALVVIDTNVSLDMTREIMRRVSDGHVMAETVAPIEEYTGDRTYEEYVEEFNPLLDNDDFDDEGLIYACPACLDI